MRSGSGNLAEEMESKKNERKAQPKATEWQIEVLVDWGVLAQNVRQFGVLCVIYGIFFAYVNAMQRIVRHLRGLDGPFGLSFEPGSCCA